MATDSLRTLIDAAKTAIAADDYATAKNKLIQAELELIVTPDSKTPESELRWGRDAITSLRSALESLDITSTGLQFKKVSIEDASTS